MMRMKIETLPPCVVVKVCFWAVVWCRAVNDSTRTDVTLVQAADLLLTFPAQTGFIALQDSSAFTHVNNLELTSANEAP